MLGFPEPLLVPDDAVDELPDELLLPDEPLLPEEPLPPEEPLLLEEPELLSPEDPELFLLVPAFDLAFVVAVP